MKLRLLILIILILSCLSFFISSQVSAAAFSIGYKKLEIWHPSVWYWGWDNCNCAPETNKCTSGDNSGKACMEGVTGSYPYGPFGGYRFTWGLESPQEIIDSLNQAKNLKVGIADYTKPMWFSGPIFTDSGGNAYVFPYSRLYCGESNYKNVAIYSAQTTNYVNWIKELAGRIKADSNLSAMTITYGLDGEARCKPNNCTHIYPTPTPSVADPCVGYDNYKNTITAAFYKNFCNGMYDNTTGFCNGTMKPIFNQGASPWGDFAGQLGKLMPPMGIKFSGFVADTLGIQYGGQWKGWGLIDAFARYRNLIPTAVEPKYGNWFLDSGGESGGQGTYWWNLEALWLRPTAIDINPNYGLRWTMQEDPDYYELINNHLNVTAETTPDVWIALRDTPQVCGAKTYQDFEKNPCLYQYSGQSGKIGDYDFFLKRPDGILGNKTIILSRPEVYGNDLTIEPLQRYGQEIPSSLRLHKFSRHIRRTDKEDGNYYMSFDIDNDYPWTARFGQNFTATVIFLDFGTGPFYLEYKNSQGSLIRKEIQRNNTRTWQKVSLTLNDAFMNDNMSLGENADGEPTYTDFRIFNGGSDKDNVYLHMIKIKGLEPKPISNKIATNIICSLPNESIIQGDSPLLEANLLDDGGNPLLNKNIRFTIDPYWFTYRIFYSQTDSTGTARKNLDLSGLAVLFAENRSAHEVEVVFPGDGSYLSSSALCYFPLNLIRADFVKRTITASLSKNQVNAGDEVIVTVNAPNGGSFSVEGEGFGMPACLGTVGVNGTGSCSFKIGGMAIAGRRNLGIIVAKNGNAAAASINLQIKVVPTLAFSFQLKKGWNNFLWKGEFPSGKNFSSIPNDCSAVSGYGNRFWQTLKKFYGGNDNLFTTNMKYSIFCQETANWGL